MRPGFLPYLPLLFVLWLAPTAGAATATTLLDEERQLYEANLEVFQQANADALAGATMQANRALGAVAEKSGRPAAYFLVANLLYKTDPKTSYLWHQRAYNAYPNDPQANLEWAMELHRHGEYAEAIPHYEKYAAASPEPQYLALLADCLVHVGRLNRAVEMWDAAGHPHCHTAIDFAICEIHGPLSPIQRRGNLLARIRAGETTLVNDLIMLDVYFDRDWWNADVFEPGLDADLRLAQEKLGAASRDYRVLAAVAAIARQEDRSAQSVRDRFAKAGFALPSDATLPSSSLVARAMIERMLDAKAATPAQVWVGCHEELWRRARAPGRDRDALHLLALLASRAQNGELASVAAFGWEQWQDPDFAASLAVDAMGRHDTSRAGVLIASARQVAPNHAQLAKLSFALAQDASDPVPGIVAAIEAEYRELSVGLAIQDSYTLKALFAQLKSALAHSTAQLTQQ